MPKFLYTYPARVHHQYIEKKLELMAFHLHLPDIISRSVSVS